MDSDIRLSNPAILEATLDGMSDGVVVCDLAGRFLVFNEPARRILGIGPVDTSPDEWSRVYGILRPDGSEPFPTDELPLVRALRGEFVDQVELLIRHPGLPGALAISVSARPLVGDGRQLGAVAVFGDITEQRRIEGAMHVRERALAAVDNGVLITDPALPDNPVIYCNDAMLRITGYSREEIVGRNCRFLQGHDRDQQAREVLREAVEREVPCQVLIRNYRRGGEMFWNELSLSPVRDESGRTTHFVGILRDATERVRLHDTRVEYQRALQTLAVQVPRAEERERRRIATELHDELAQKLSFALLTMNELGRSTAPEGRAALERLEALLREAVEQVRSLIFELSPPVLWELGFGAAVEWLAERFETRHGVTCRVVDEGAPASLDEEVAAVLFQAVRELLQNVAKHARATRAEVRLASEEGRIRVEVVDDGAGFDPERLERALAGGSGFGLFNVRERLRNLGGSCDVLDAEGGGARVVLHAPGGPSG